MLRPDARLGRRASLWRGLLRLMAPDHDGGGGDAGHSHGVSADADRGKLTVTLALFGGRIALPQGNATRTAKTGTPNLYVLR